MKKFIKSMLVAFVTSIIAVSTIFISVSAEPAHGYEMLNTRGLINIPDGTYYSNSDPGSFITIYAKSGSCMVYLVFNRNGRRICGTGTYYAYTGADYNDYINFTITSWHYENDGTVYNNNEQIFTATYTNGGIILKYNNEIFTK